MCKIIENKIKQFYKKSVLIPKDFKYALLDELITEEEYNNYFQISAEQKITK